MGFLQLLLLVETSRTAASPSHSSKKLNKQPKVTDPGSGEAISNPSFLTLKLTTLNTVLITFQIF